MNGALSIATSGLAAASLQLDVSASNVANAQTSGALPAGNGSSATAGPSAYVPLRVNQVDVANGTAGGGTAATALPVSPSYVPIYDPSAPYANSSGLVATPNVELANEAVQQMVARYTFAANANVVRTASQMLKSLLDIKA
jgi:flagellar basal-body rod protein FlgC